MVTIIPTVITQTMYVHVYIYLTYTYIVLTATNRIILTILTILTTKRRCLTHIVLPIASVHHEIPLRLSAYHLPLSPSKI